MTDVAFVALACGLIIGLGAIGACIVIGVMGVGGKDPGNEDNSAFREAMAAPAAWPEFKGNVAAVATAPFWAEELAAIDQKRAKVKQMGHLLKVKAIKECKKSNLLISSLNEQSLFNKPENTKVLVYQYENY